MSKTIAILAFATVLVLLFYPQMQFLTETMANEAQTSQKSILLIYGNSRDLYFGQQLGNADGISLVTRNVSETLAGVNLGEYRAVWWLVSIPHNASLSAIRSSSWQKDNKGIFVISNQLKGLDCADREWLGIKTASDYQYPASTTQNLTLQLTTESSHLLNMQGETNFSLVTNTALIVPNENMVRIANISLPLPPATSLQSGIFASLSEHRILCTFQAPQLANSSINNPLKMLLKSVSSEQGDLGIISLFQQLALFTSSGEMPEVPNEVFGFNLDLNNIPFPIAALAGLLGLAVLWFMGLNNIIKGFIFGFVVLLLTVISHLYYTPSSRRLTRYDLESNEARAAIIEFLEQRGVAGAHVREIQRQVKSGISSLLWHLQLLEDFNILEKRKVGRYHIYYLADLQITKNESEISAVLRSNVANMIWSQLASSKKPLRLSSISKSAKCHHETARYHLKRFIELNMVTVIQDGNKTLYMAVPAIVSYLNEEQLRGVAVG